MPDLIDYQDAAYARRYADVVKKAVQAEQKAVPGQSGYAEAVARFLYKLMAYKDEYEVARLHADPKFLAKLDAQFKDGYTLQYHLAPPTLQQARPDDRRAASRSRTGRRCWRRSGCSPSSRACAAVRSTSSARPRSGGTSGR